MTDVVLVWNGRVDEPPSSKAEAVPAAADRSSDKDDSAANPETPWPQWYAERIVEHFTAAGE